MVERLFSFSQKKKQAKEIMVEMNPKHIQVGNHIDEKYHI
jgi:hypothetical protein